MLEAFQSFSQIRSHMHGSVDNYIVHVGEYACTLYNCIIHRAKMCDEHISLNKRAHFAHFPKIVP